MGDICVALRYFVFANLCTCEFFMSNDLNKSITFKQVVKTMSLLRSKKGCPWDRLQTHKSLLKYLKEESKEVEQAVKNNDYNNLKEELGDILLQVIFHAQIAEENGYFDIYDVLRTLQNKLIRRHPHVYGKKKLKTAEEVLLSWDRIKRKEKR